MGTTEKLYRFSNPVKMDDSPLALTPASTNPLDALRGTVSGITVAQQEVPVSPKYPGARAEIR